MSRELAPSSTQLGETLQRALDQVIDEQGPDATRQLIGNTFDIEEFESILAKIGSPAADSYRPTSSVESPVTYQQEVTPAPRLVPEITNFLAQNIRDFLTAKPLGEGKIELSQYLETTVPMTRREAAEVIGHAAAAGFIHRFHGIHFGRYRLEPVDNQAAMRKLEIVDQASRIFEFFAFQAPKEIDTAGLSALLTHLGIDKPSQNDRLLVAESVQLLLDARYLVGARGKPDKPVASAPKAAEWSKDKTPSQAELLIAYEATQQQSSSK